MILVYPHAQKHFYTFVSMFNIFKKEDILVLIPKMHIIIFLKCFFFFLKTTLKLSDTKFLFLIQAGSDLYNLPKTFSAPGQNSINVSLYDWSHQEVDVHSPK